MTAGSALRSTAPSGAPRRLVVGIAGASGSIYGIRLLEVLREVPGLETHLIISRAGKRTLVEETEYTVRDVEALAARVYDDRDIGAALASGSLRTAGMVVARELALRRWRVILLEGSTRLGGKAGADRKNGRMVEHGYHVFPLWYPNVRTIVSRLGHLRVKSE